VKRLTFIFALLAVLLAACEKPKPPPPRAAPSQVRIVSVSPAVGIMLADLHYDHLCVGRDAHDLALHRSIPVVGNQNAIDYEAVIAANPTHVFTQWGSRDLPARLVDLGRVNNWKVIDSRLLSMDDIRLTTVQLDQELCTATGAKAPSEACRDLLARMDVAWTRPAEKDYSKLGKVLLLAQTSPPAAFGPGSCHYQLLEKLGVKPAIGSGAAYITLDSEDLLHLAPDAIILINPRSPDLPPPSPEDAKKLRDARFAAIAALDLPAAKSGRMAVIDDPRGFIPSTSLIRVAEEVREVLDGWLPK
jgi:ABC-type hemin transport system substrate-binding protein